ncbi:regulatory protein RecX [Oecophyllibacter saccharovorans]|uniref:regulatory protein RecX n=1 Tax=Oecophyllibacter saccharovorans TaxID=2558360 RepID=UPI001141EC74|nr:RecX family transcriptional regulator [Oecophyllibacter saccharovorans]QDH15273.1 regulatory protein RecX [Oecophyllibacter saccharovorans]
MVEEKAPAAVPTPPTAASLREAALAHLARFATTRRNLEQVLSRRVRRWGLRAQKAGMAPEEIRQVEGVLLGEIPEIAAGMEALGAVDDAQFARSRARSLTRSGRSRRAVTAHLVVKGVDGETAQEALEASLGAGEEAQQAELAAALVLARKRGFGAFRRPDRPERDPMKVLAVFARNGFSQGTAAQALAMERDEAEDLILRFRSA